MSEEELLEVRAKVIANIKARVLGSVGGCKSDPKRIFWENSNLPDIADEDYDKFMNILDEACKGTGYAIEPYSSCEGHLYRD